MKKMSMFSSPSFADTCQLNPSDGLPTFHFPNDLIAEILYHLPVKPLLRFRSVSKPWCSVIDSPRFVKKHLRRSIECNPDAGIVIRSGGNFYLANLDSLDNATAIKIHDPLMTRLYGTEYVGSCNGLVCLFNSEKDDLLGIFPQIYGFAGGSSGSAETDIFLWNPLTMKCKMLPSIPTEFPRFSKLSRIGFGYDHLTDDYKLVRIEECNRLSSTIVIVYSLKSNSWRQVENIPSHICFTGKWGMFSSGSLHWLADKDPEESCSIVVAFDLGTEKYREVPFPAVLNATFDEHFSHRTSVIFRGCFGIIDNYPGSHMDVWLLNYHGVENSWSKLFSLELPGIGFGRPVTNSKSGMHVLLQADSKKLMWYDLERKKSKDVVIHGIPNGTFNSYVYCESLVQLTEDVKFDGKQLPKQSEEKKEKKQQQKNNEMSKFLSKGFKLKL